MQQGRNHAKLASQNFLRFIVLVTASTGLVLGGLYPDWQRLLTLIIYVVASMQWSASVCLCELSLYLAARRVRLYGSDQGYPAQSSRHIQTRSSVNQWLWDTDPGVFALAPAIQCDIVQDYNADEVAPADILQNHNGHATVLDGNLAVGDSQEAELARTIAEARQVIRQERASNPPATLPQGSREVDEGGICYTEVTCHKYKLRSRITDGLCPQRFCEHRYCFRCHRPGCL